jgi:hypothetical protein
VVDRLIEPYEVFVEQWQGSFDRPKTVIDEARSTSNAVSIGAGRFRSRIY